MEIILATPRGFCAGVQRAVRCVEDALGEYGVPVYVVHEIVHNRLVVDDLARRGAVFVESPDEIPLGAVCVLSAHGVSRAVQDGARARGLRVLDATCPLVSRLHRQVVRHGEAGREVVVVGHEDHPEVRGTRGRATGRTHVAATPGDVARLAPRPANTLAYVTHTTLALDEIGPVIEALHQRFPGVAGQALEDVCYAAQNRQEAVRQLAEHAEVIVVAGAAHSSNANRLTETARRCPRRAHLVERVDDRRPEWIAGVEHVGVTGAASAPESMIAAVVERLFGLGAMGRRERDGVREQVSFAPVEICFDGMRQGQGRAGPELAAGLAVPGGTGANAGAPPGPLRRAPARGCAPRAAAGTSRSGGW